MKATTARLALALLAMILLSACDTGGGEASSTYTRTDLAKDLAERIAAGYGDLSAALEDLSSTGTAYCQRSGTETDFSALQEKWLAANRAWQSVQTINFGPVAQENRRFTIAFYPVSKKTLESRLTDFLERSDAPVTPDSNALNSVSLKGLPALEYLLFRDDAQARFDGNRRHCAYLEWVASSLAGIAAELNRQWQPEGEYAAQLAAEDNAQVLLENLLNAINEHLSIIGTSKLGKSLEGSVDAVESPYARQSLANVTANLAFIRSLYGDKTEAGITRRLNAEGQELVADEMLVRLNLVMDSLQPLQQTPLAGDLVEETRQRLGTVTQLIHSVQEYNATKVADSLGIFIGFNSADGD